MDFTITVDFLLIGRCLLALGWGIGLACWLQFSRFGQFVATERTWLAVVAGVGLDLVIAIGGTWADCAAVVASSSLGIIARSLINESQHHPDLHAYRTLWGMEDGIDATGDVIGLLERALRDETLGGAQARCSEALARLHQAQRTLTTARYGSAEQHSRRGTR